jgi:hypothetical protein
MVSASTDGVNATTRMAANLEKKGCFRKMCFEMAVEYLTIIPRQEIDGLKAPLNRLDKVSLR